VDLGTFRAAADEATAATAERVLRRSIVFEVQETRSQRRYGEKRKGELCTDIPLRQHHVLDRHKRPRRGATTLMTAGAISPPAWIEMLGIHGGYLPS
jgi:hypothetical protein